jgi:hypothetical protein
MKNLKKFPGFLNEWLDSPGSIDVPGQNTEIRVNSRNYTPAHQPLPYIEDAMYEKSKIYDMLDEYGNSEDFNKFLGEKKRSGREVTDRIKDVFGNRK